MNNEQTERILGRANFMNSHDRGIEIEGWDANMLEVFADHLMADGLAMILGEDIT